MFVEVLGVAGAIVFTGAGLWSLTPKERRRSSALGVPGSLPLALFAIGASYAWGVFVESLVPMLLGVLILIPANVVLSRSLRGREVPPVLAELEDLKTRPLEKIRQPVAHSRAVFRTLGHPLKNRSATNEFEERGL